MTAADLLDALRLMSDEQRREAGELLGVRMPGGLLDAREAARTLGLHEKTVARLAREGRLPAKKVGREWRFPADALTVKPAERRRVSHAQAPARASRRRSTALTDADDPFIALDALTLARETAKG